MSEQEPGLELHEWETRWSELQPLLDEHPAEALPAACDFLEQVLREAEIPTPADGANPELLAPYRAARETSDRVERGEDVDAGDVAAAIENLRALYETLRETRPE